MVPSFELGIRGADGFEVSGRDFLGIHVRLVKNDGGIEGGVDFEIAVETFAAGNITFGANQRRRRAPSR